jgi:hypothetical protein
VADRCVAPNPGAWLTATATATATATHKAIDRSRRENKRNDTPIRVETSVRRGDRPG